MAQLVRQVFRAQQEEQGGKISTKLLTTEFLLLILSVSAVGGSVTDLAGWDASHSVVTQEACPVIGGCTEAVR